MQYAVRESLANSTKIGEFSLLGNILKLSVTSLGDAPPVLSGLSEDG